MRACVVAPRCARSIEFEKTSAVSREKGVLQSAPCAVWVSATLPSPAKNLRHPLPNSRALAHRLRAAATHCFNFVAIMRQSAANGKQNTAVRAAADALRCGSRRCSRIARACATRRAIGSRAFLVVDFACVHVAGVALHQAPQVTSFGRAPIDHRLSDAVLAHAVKGIRHLAAALHHLHFAQRSRHGTTDGNRRRRWSTDTIVYAIE